MLYKQVTQGSQQPREEGLGKVLGDPHYPVGKMRTREDNCLSYDHTGSQGQRKGDKPGVSGFSHWARTPSKLTPSQGSRMP